jgi:hypothetical protein
MGTDGRAKSNSEILPNSKAIDAYLEKFKSELEFRLENHAGRI